MLKDERMKAIYDAVREGVTVCDVGTDHALIPIELILSGRCNNCIITDISAPSLEKGVLNAKKSGCADKITAYCTNGTLGALFDGEIDFIIAGMGGELISQILEQDKRLKSSDYRFVLQPMSKAEELRRYLSDNGFEVLKEIKVESMGKIYPVINAVYTSKPTEVSQTVRLLGFEKVQTELEKKYAIKLAKTLEYKLDGVKSAEKQDQEQIKEIENQISAVKKSLV